jgi:CO dehydrogenase maturation factor
VVLVVVEPSFESIALAEKIKDLAAGINKQLWAVLNKISSDNLIDEIKTKLKCREMETIGVISYDASVFHAGLKGDTLIQGRATHQAGEILEFLLTAIKR